MKNLLSGFLFLWTLVANCALHAQMAPSIEWQKSLGGSDYDEAYSIQQTADGGFIVAGYCSLNDGDVSGNHGGSDYWIVKLDASGNLVWQKSLGGSGYDRALSIQQTNEGGFIVAGYSESNDGDVSENHGGYDYWIVKLDANGILVWQKSLGGNGDDKAQSIQQVTDGGFIVAGYSGSNDGDVSENHGGYDYWILKLDANGILVWQKSLGGNGADKAQSIQQVTGGGFIVAGGTSSNDGNVSGHHGYLLSPDYWIVKLDANGILLWQKSLGGSENDYAFSIQQTSDGEFIAAGYTESNDGDVSGNHLDSNGYNSSDYWIVKLDSSGNIVWQKCLGGEISDAAYSIKQTIDGDFIVAGWTVSNNGDVSGNHGNTDYWIVKLNAHGDLIWQKSLGGSYFEKAFSVQQIADGGFIVAGFSESNDGNVSGHHGSTLFRDYWIVKLSSDISGIATLSNNIISMYPNPVQTQLNINLATLPNEMTIRVYDLQGRIITLGTTFRNTRAQLNTTSLANGFYSLQIINNKTGEIKAGKFVKQ